VHSQPVITVIPGHSFATSRFLPIPDGNAKKRTSPKMDEGEGNGNKRAMISIIALICVLLPLLSKYWKRKKYIFISEYGLSI
jgi:hypothetical protein